MKNKRKSAFEIGLAIVISIISGYSVFAEEIIGKEGVTKNAGNIELSYEIGSGDILSIVTWKEPDFTSDEILVRIDGKITFPLLDDLQAAGKTPLQLKEKIQNLLKNYVTNPLVTVSIRNPVSQRFYVLGEVVKTGEYPLSKNLTVLQAFALAGGFTEWASKNEIVLLRRSNATEKIIRLNYKSIIKGKDLSQNIPIIADDTIIVP